MNTRPSQMSSDPTSETVYEMIRERILDGTFESGDHLVEAEMARLAKASRTPVREALRRLAGEGLVTIGATRRTRVAEFGDEEMRAIYEIRVRLESYTAGLAARNCTEKDVMALTEINKAIEQLGSEVSSSTLKRFYDLNLEFHKKIVSMSGSKQLELALATALRVPIALLKHHIRRDRVQIALSRQQHEEIILAMKSGNEKWASACMASHIETSRPVGAR